MPNTRVLLVEDDEVVATGVRWTLELEGIDVEVVRTGEAVIPAVRSFRPHVVVMDLRLPDCDGRTVYEELAAAFDLPVIFSTGHARAEEIAELLEERRVAVLLKPYSTADLLSAIAGCIAARRVR